MALNNIFDKDLKFSNNESIDSIIMCYYEDGLPYFTHLLTKCKESNNLDSIELISKYINTYLKCFLQTKISNSYLRTVKKYILEFHRALENTNLTLTVKELWLFHLYTYLIDDIKYKFTPEKLMYLNELFKSEIFFNYFKKQELNNSLLSYEYETNTILGNIIFNFTCNNKIINSKKYLEILIKDEEQGSCYLIKWILKMQEKNKASTYISSISSDYVSEQFMLNVLRLCIVFWNATIKPKNLNNNLKNLDDNSIVIYNCILKQIEISVYSLLSKYTYYSNRLKDINILNITDSYEPYLNRLSIMLTKKAKNYKNLITTNKLLTLNYVGSFYNWFIPLIITIDNQVLNIDELDLLRTYFDFYIKTLFLYKELLITDTELMIDLNKISIKIFTNNHIKNTSDSIYTIKLIAFKTYHLSKSLIINYEHQVIKNISNILINLYINCTKNPENTYCHILITYFYDNTQLLTSDLIESVDIDIFRQSYNSK